VTLDQLNHVDRETRLLEEERETYERASELVYRRISVLINGTPVALMFNIAELREALGLPNFSLTPPFRAPSTPATQVAHNAEDVDHADDEPNARPTFFL
jgi:hypothetical protein